MAFIEGSCFVTVPSFSYFIMKTDERKQRREEIFKGLDQEEEKQPKIFIDSEREGNMARCLVLQKDHKLCSVFVTFSYSKRSYYPIQGLYI